MTYHRTRQKLINIASGVINAWGWGFSRVLDAVTQVVPEFDVKRVGAIGCSRNGKAALAAGIFDERVRNP